MGIRPVDNKHDIVCRLVDMIDKTLGSRRNFLICISSLLQGLLGDLVQLVKTPERSS